MPKWTIALIAAVFAGIIGLISGGLLTRVDRAAADKIENELEQSQQIIIQLEKKIKTSKNKQLSIKDKLENARKTETQLRQALTEQKTEIKEYDKQEKSKIAANEAKIKREKKKLDRNWEKSKRKREKSQLQKMEEGVRTMLNEDVIHSINFEFKEVRLDPLMWSMFTLEEKQGMVNFFSNYFSAKGDAGNLTILSNRNDTKLATLGLWSGIKILQ